MTDKEVELIPIMVLSNDPTEFKIRTIELLYQSISMGQLAYMDGKDAETGEIVPLLVGLNPVTDERVEIYPIAKLLINNADTATKYLVPNGTGEYTEPDSDNAVDFACAELVPADAGEEEAGQAQGLDKKATGTLH